MQIFDKENLARYANCMDEIMKRDLAIRSILNNSNTTLFPITNIEFMALQLRKILELIALANLVANIDQYEQARESFMHDWNPQRIIKKILSFNDKFYPQPITRGIDEKTGYTKWIDKKNGILTIDEYYEGLNFTSNLLHSKNPFLTPGETSIDDYKLSIKSYLAKIIELLNEHIIYLVSGDILNCVMLSVDGKTANVTYFGRVGEENLPG